MGYRTSMVRCRGRVAARSVHKFLCRTSSTHQSSGGPPHNQQHVADAPGGKWQGSSNDASSMHSATSPFGLSGSGHSLQPLSAEERRIQQTDLSKNQRSVVIEKKAEPAHSGVTANGLAFNSSDEGTYVSVVGGLPVFHSSHK